MTDTDDSTDAADTERGVTGRPGKAGWGPYGRRPARVLAAVAFVDAVDRGILPGVLTQVQDDIGFSDTQAGLLGTAFVLTGFLVVLPAGYLADRAPPHAGHRRRAGAVGRDLGAQRAGADLLAVPGGARGARHR